MKNLLISTITLLILIPIAHALEVDEKLTFRLLRVTDTKKTVLINRGLEDGLVVGDHAKFFLTTGVIARGVVVKASPTRSIWSVYRLVDPTQIISDRVMKLKISRPVKITDDPTRILTPEPSVSSIGTNADIAMVDDNLSTLDKAELRDLVPAQSRLRKPGTFNQKQREVWGLFHLSSLSTSTDQGDDVDRTGSTSSVNFSVGLEYYLAEKLAWYKQISLFGLAHKGTTEVTGIEGDDIGSSVTEFGVGANWHFLHDPMTFGRMIPFASVSIGIGKVSDTIDIDRSALVTSQTFDGDSSFFSVGGGFKYFIRSGFGARVVADFYSRGESYAVDDAVVTDYTKTLSGFRLMGGLGYRW